VTGAVYLGVGAAVSALGLGLALSDRTCVLRDPAYWAYLATPWRAATWLIATVGLAAIAPYTGDPYWDYAVAVGMATGVGVTGPWAVGELWRATRRQASAFAVWGALGAAWLTVAGVYDGWNLIRWGHYPVTWQENLPASGALYLLGGLFWSLDARPEFGVHLGFVRSDWPSAERGGVRRLLPYLVPVAAFVSFLIISFVTGWL
jgi:hypothetical protein